MDSEWFVVLNSFPRAEANRPADLFAKWYVRDGEEYRDQAAADVPEVEADGMLNGKRVVEPDEDIPSVCPFSGKSSAETNGNGVNGKANGASGGCPFSGVKEAEALAGLKINGEEKA